MIVNNKKDDEKWKRIIEGIMISFSIISVVVFGWLSLYIDDGYRKMKSEMDSTICDIQKTILHQDSVINSLSEEVKHRSDTLVIKYI